MLFSLDVDETWSEDTKHVKEAVRDFFDEVAMEKQSVWNDFVNLRRLLGNAGKNTNAKQI